MITNFVLIFRRGEISDFSRDQRPHKLFPALSESGVEDLERQARNHLKRSDVTKIIVPPAEAYEATVRCLLNAAEIAWVKDYVEDPAFAPDQKNFQIWADTVKKAGEKADQEGQVIAPRHFLDANEKLILDTGAILFGKIEALVKISKPKDIVLIVSEKGFIESILLFVARENGILGLTNILNEGEAVLLSFKNRVLYTISYYAHQPKRTPEDDELDNALINYMKRRR